jgi:pimeloyl-ACP methyl ester carboxylesterase
VALSNIERVRGGTAPVGSFGGMSASGTMDMAGNVREWCLNQSKSSAGRYILGGGWNDPSYSFYESAIHSPFDRSPTNGIRLVQPVPAQDEDGTADLPIEPIFRDYHSEQPVPDQTFRFYRRLFAYDPLPLNPRAERRDSSAQWIREKVSYDAGYGGERVTAHVLLPLRGRPPYQTVVFFPGSNTLRTRSSSDTLLSVGLFDFLVQGGRAVVYPVYKGTYERDDGTRISDPDPSNRYKEHVIHWQREVSRTLDYLGTRSDIDTTKLAYLGFSWGGRIGGVVLAIEPRFKAAVLTVAGLNFRSAQPEVDDINYMPRVKTPVLMLNGRHDNTFPLETAAKPMFDLLGTPPEHKRHVIADGVHYVPRTTLIRETLAWLDRYLEPVR